MDVTAWLTELGMERYAEQFTTNEIDEDTLRKLSSGDLLELGVSVLAHRKKNSICNNRIGQCRLKDRDNR